MHKSEQSKQLAASLRHEILEPIKEVLRKQANEVRKMTTDGKNLEKHLKSKIESTEKVYLMKSRSVYKKD
jgi:hypothetical protein